MKAIEGKAKTADVIEAMLGANDWHATELAWRQQAAPARDGVARLGRHPFRTVSLAKVLIYMVGAPGSNLGPAD
jgi:hypothetical protein